MRPPPSSKLHVSEIFTSIQGEGPFTGRPSVFLRLALCNLSCLWCDTPYTWLFNRTLQEKVNARHSPATHAPSSPPQPVYFNRKQEVKTYPIPKVKDLIQQAAGDHVRTVVVTGGEPLLQKQALRGLVDGWVSQGWNVEFETNGTVSPAGLAPGVHLNVSPKLAHAQMPRERRVNVNVLKECDTFESAVFKFVVGEQSDIDEVHDIVAEVGVDRRRVFLMPMGTVSCGFFWS